MARWGRRKSGKVHGQSGTNRKRRIDARAIWERGGKTQKPEGIGGGGGVTMQQQSGANGESKDDMMPKRVARSQVDCKTVLSSSSVRNWTCGCPDGTRNERYRLFFLYLVLSGIRYVRYIYRLSVSLSVQNNNKILSVVVVLFSSFRVSTMFICFCLSLFFLPLLFHYFYRIIHLGLLYCILLPPDRTLFLGLITFPLFFLDIIMFAIISAFLFFVSPTCGFF